MYKREKNDSQSSDNCQFCKMDGSEQCVKNYKNFLLVANIFPYEDNHLLLMPIRHVNSELAFNSEELTELAAIHREILAMFYRNFNMCFYFTRENTPDQSMWHWHRHYIPTDKVLKNGIQRTTYKGVTLKIE